MTATPEAVQLRRYQIAPGQLDSFIEEWRKLLPIREQFGMRLLFAFADRDRDQFVWASAADAASFEDIEARYYASQRRRYAGDAVSTHIVSTQVGKVEVVAALTEWPTDSRSIR